MKNLVSSACTFFILVLSFFSTESEAQEDKAKFELIASIQPLFAASNALHLDIELKQSKMLNFIISPELYSGYAYDKAFFAGSEDLKSDQVQGAGIGLAHKISLSKNQNKPYISYGAIYRKININYHDEGYLPYQKDGLEYYEYGNFSDRLKINSVLMNICAGVQTENFGRFILDFYAGAGYKISSKKSAYPDERHYDQGNISVAYNGITFLAGIKAGFKIK